MALRQITDIVMSQLYFLVMCCLNKPSACKKKNLLKITSWGREECWRIEIYGGKMSVPPWIYRVSFSLLAVTTFQAQ